MTDPLTSVEVYDVCTNVWTRLSDMTMKRAGPCCVAAGPKIYVIGGGIIGKFYESVEVFDTRSLTWSAVSPMRERRCDARAVAVDSDLYVFGGYRRIECPSAAHSGNSLKLCGVEYYSAKRDFWMPVQNRSRVQPMSVLGERFQINGVLNYGDDILVVGELDMNGDTQAVQLFNPYHSNSWEGIIVNLPHHQSRYQCCLLDLPRSLLHTLLMKHDPSQVISYTSWSIRGKNMLLSKSSQLAIHSTIILAIQSLESLKELLVAYMEVLIWTKGFSCTRNLSLLGLINTWYGCNECSTVSQKIINLFLWMKIIMNLLTSVCDCIV